MAKKSVCFQIQNLFYFILKYPIYSPLPINAEAPEGLLKNKSKKIFNIFSVITLSEYTVVLQAKMPASARTYIVLG